MFAHLSTLCLSLARPAISGRALVGCACAMSTPIQSRRRPLSCCATGGATAVTEAPAETEPAVKKRVLSGVQPTGVLHLGNYLGAIRQWVKNQEVCIIAVVGRTLRAAHAAAARIQEYDNYFCVVDLHAITAPHVPKELTKDTYRTAALYLASGIDPERSTVFVQSHVTAHAELAWLLNCATPMGWLEKMIQFKEKKAKQV